MPPGGLSWRAAFEVTCLGYDREPRCEPVVAYAIAGKDHWVMTEDGRVLRVLRERGDRLCFPGDLP